MNTVGALVGTILFSLAVVPVAGTHRAQQLLVVVAAVAALLMLTGGWRRRAGETVSPVVAGPRAVVFGAGVLVVLLLGVWVVPQTPNGLVARLQ